MTPNANEQVVLDLMYPHIKENIVRLMDEHDHTFFEAMLLAEHDQDEELHPFVAHRRDEDHSGWECSECGDTAEGLMHNNTWRNAEPLIE